MTPRQCSSWIISPARSEFWRRKVLTKKAGAHRLSSCARTFQLLKNPCGEQVCLSLSFVMTALPPPTNFQKITQNIPMQKQKKKQVAFLLRVPASGSLITTPADVKDASTEARSSAPFLSPVSSPLPRQIRRTQYGKRRIPKRFLISQTY